MTKLYKRKYITDILKPAQTHVQIVHIATDLSPYKTRLMLNAFLFRLTATI